MYLGGDNLPDSLYNYPGNYLVLDNSTASLNSMFNFDMRLCSAIVAFWCEMPPSAFPCYPVRCRLRASTPQQAHGASPMDRGGKRAWQRASCLFGWISGIIGAELSSQNPSADHALCACFCSRHLRRRRRQPRLRRHSPLCRPYVSGQKPRAWLVKSRI